MQSERLKSGNFFDRMFFNINQTAPIMSIPLPLSGVRIIDFSRLLPGPFATRILAEMGADVIKVEPPEIGDPSRYNHPTYREHSVYFNEVNAGKRSITLDLASMDGRNVVHRLLKNADVVIETYRPGVAKKLGIDYDSVSVLNPRAIYCSISGFGQNGSLSHIAGHDLVIQGLTGLMGCALELANPPAVPGFQAADYAGALFSVIGIQAALAQREKTGKGCNLDIAMFEALFNMCLLPLSSEMARSSGYSGEPRMESYGGNPRYSTYLSKDGKPIAVTLLETKAWHQFCLLTERPELISEDESQADRLSSHGARSAQYRQALADYCASHTWAELMDRMHETGIAICPICTPEEALQLPHVKERGLLQRHQDPAEGDIPSLTSPLARAGLTGPRQPAPRRGEHAREILSELGFNAAEISNLGASGVVEWPSLPRSFSDVAGE